jgi:hypothetical protein
MKIFNIGNESIAFQTGAFFRALIPIIQDARAAGTTDPKELGKYAVRLDQCIYDHTGITTTIKFIEDYDNDFVLIPTLTKGHVLRGADFQKLVDKYFDIDQVAFLDVEKKGWIDSANSRVGGAFSEIVFRTYLGTNDMLASKYTPEESVATILHEVGHAFTFLQFLADTVMINHVMQRSYQELTTSNPDKKVRLILSKAADALEIKNRDWIQAITDETDGETAFRVLASAAVIEPRRMDNKIYFSQDTAEELAEIFAVRHGAGRALMTMRSKAKYVSRSYGYLQAIAWSLGSLLLLPILPEVGAPLFTMGIIYIFTALGTQAGLAKVIPDMTTFKQTATKIRNQFVEQLKAGKLPKQDVADIIESIELTDKTIQGYNADFDRDWMIRFFDMFRRGRMDARSSREYTDKLEVLVSNDLFIRSAQLAAR